MRNRIVREVARRGRVSFAEFMELALYHPTGGYYTRRRKGPGPVGAQGDFITAPTAGPLFARTLARLLRRLAEIAREPLTFIELGAGEGLLLRQLLPELGGVGGGVLARAVAVEVAEWAREHLSAACSGVEVRARLSDHPRPAGIAVLFASELYDALPVHRVTMRRVDGELELVEYFVEADEDGELHWRLDEAVSPGIEPYLAEHGVTLEEGQIAEVRPRARSLHAEHLAWCGKSALALLIDYGYPARQLYNPRGRRQGSLAGYRGHSLVDDVLRDPGEIDLTAHVNFDDLMNAAADLGWERGELRPLGSFLAMHGMVELLPAAAAKGEPLSASDWVEMAAVKRLLAPSGMGADLKVLAQGKGGAWQAYLKLATPPPVDA